MMKSSFTKDMLKVLKVLDEIGNDLKVDCENAMELSFRGMMGDKLTIEQMEEVLYATADMEVRTSFQRRLTAVVRAYADKYCPDEEVEGA